MALSKEEKLKLLKEAAGLLQLLGDNIDHRCVEGAEAYENVASGLVEMATELETAKSDLPMQPIVVDSTGEVRFRYNKVVKHLLHAGNINLNDLARLRFPDEDMAQFAQLIGYSVSGWGDLSYVSPEMYEEVDERARALAEPEKK